MNIFYTNIDVVACAKDHCDVHTRKMIIEYAQMLSTAHRVLDGNEYADKNGLYKETHKNHPCTIWARSGTGNYFWLYGLLYSLCVEFSDARSKIHATSRLLGSLSKLPKNIEIREFVEPPQCMPDECKSDLTIVAYRKYLNVKFSEWRNKNFKFNWYKEVPVWVD